MKWCRTGPKLGRVAVSVISLALLTAGCRAAATPALAGGLVGRGTRRLAPLLQ